MEWFTYGTFDSREHGFYVFDMQVYGAAERDVEFITIPGRNGDVIRDNGRFKNITVKYICIMMDGFESGFDAIKMQLKSMIGYQRIEDSFAPDKYRMGVLTAEIIPQTRKPNHAAKFEIVFNCMPQHYLKSGEKDVEYSKVVAGGIDASGQDVSYDLASFNHRIEYTPVTPGKTFSVKAKYAQNPTGYVLTIYWYDSNKSFLSKQESASGQEQRIDTVVPSGASYARIMFPNGCTFGSPARGVQVRYDGNELVYGEGGVFLINPTGYDAKPIIKLNNSRASTIEIMRLGPDNNIVNNVTNIDIADFSETMRDDIVIDSNLGLCYSERFRGFHTAKYNLDQYVTITDYSSELADFPTFSNGGNLISITSNAETYSILPGWWTV